MKTFLKFRERIGKLSYPLLLEFEQLLTVIRATFRAEHLDNGTHGDVTATSFTGPLTGTVTGNVTGNASTATALQTARAINGVNFDGTAAITVTAAAGTLTGTTLASGVTASSLTSFGTVTSGDVQNSWRVGTDTGYGYVNLVRGNSTHMGYVEFIEGDGTRRGYLGWELADVSMNLENSAHFVVAGGAIKLPEQSDPTGVANYGLLYTRDNGAGKTQLCVRFGSGAVQVIATEP